MDPLLTSIVGGAGFAIGAVCSYLRLRRQVRWAPAVFRMAVAAALIINVVHLASRMGTLGVVEALRYSFDDAIVLATLVGLMGVGTHLARALQGVDGFLLIAATVIQFGAISVVNQQEMQTTERAWFVSHALAFAVSGTLFIAGGVAGIAYLLVNRMLRRKRPTTLVGNVASLEALERFGRWTPILGFPLFTYGILTGLCGVWHRPSLKDGAWYLDQVFISSIVAWLVYGYLCYGSMYLPQIRGKRAAVLSTYGMGLIVVAFLFRWFWSSLHQ